MTTSEYELEVLQGTVSMPFATRAVATCNNGNPAASIKIPGRESASKIKIITNQNGLPLLSQFISVSNKDEKDTGSSTSPLNSLVTKENQDEGYSTSPTTAIETVGILSTNELSFSTPDANLANIHQEYPANEGQQTSTFNASLPPDPPAYHDIIPLMEEGSNVPPPHTFKSLCFCFFDSYRQYYAIKIRNSRWMLILLVFFLAIPISAIYMGAKYFNSCSLAPIVPILLFIKGILGLLLIILRILMIMSRSFKNFGMCEPPELLIESTGLFILCIMVVEVIPFFKKLPVYDDPGSPFYCEKLLHTYVFCMNFVVLGIGILAFLLYLPEKPVDSIYRCPQDASLRQQQNMDRVPSPVYPAWVKPRRRGRSRRNEELSTNDDSALSGNEEAVSCVSTSNQTKDFTNGGTVQGFQRVDSAITGAGRIHWLDDVGTVNEVIGCRQSADESTVVGIVGGHLWEEGDVAGDIEDRCFYEEGAAGGVVRDHRREKSSKNEAIGGRNSGEVGNAEGIVAVYKWDVEGSLGGTARRQWCSKKSAVGEFIGGRRENDKGALSGYRINRWLDEEDTGRGGFRSFLMEETRDSVPQRKNKKATGFRHWRQEQVTEDVTFPSQRYGEDNSESDFVALRILKEVGDLSARRWEEYGARPKKKESYRCGVGFSRIERVPGDGRYQQIESTATSAGLLRSVENAESYRSETSINGAAQFGARPKRSRSVECGISAKKGSQKETKHIIKESSDYCDKHRLNESGEVAEEPSRIRKTSPNEDVGNQRNISYEGGVKSKRKETGAIPKKKVTGAIPKKKKSAEGKSNIEGESKEVAEGSTLQKLKGSFESGTTTKMSETADSSSRRKENHHRHQQQRK